MHTRVRTKREGLRMSDENVELQELLATEGTAEIEKTTRKRTRGYAIPDDEVAEEAPKKFTDDCQWAVGANSTFRAAGSTIKKLKSAVYGIEADMNGLYFNKINLATDSLIDLDDTAGKKVIEGIREFWKSRTLFKNYGIMFKRGVLLWGPPGSGKTVTVTMLMQDLIKAGGLVVICTNPAITTIALKQLRRIEPDRNLIVVMEDIEEMVDNFGEHDLLSLLDGEHKIENVVNIATTNYPEKLGARMVNRPSRFDEVIKIGMPSANTRRKYLESSGIRLTKEEVEKWVRESEGFSIAHLKELVAAVGCLGRDYEATYKRLKTMRTLPKSSSSETSFGFGKE